MQTERLSQASKDANGGTPKAALTPSESEQQIGEFLLEIFLYVMQMVYVIVMKSHRLRGDTVFLNPLLR